MNTADLSSYSKRGYKPGRNVVIRALWYVVNYTLFVSPFFPFNGIKRLILRIFGAKIGKEVVIKPRVNIKYPWLLAIGNNSWIGEGAWIDNLALVTIGNNCCISQGVLIETGSHNYKSPDFHLITAPVTIEDGVWICAKATITAGTTCHSHSVLSAGSIAPVEMQPYGIYKGNPAVKIRERVINA
ncbi:MAG: WcaF family extracellular polysaccharide biosynthesis acetyltransferase [Bacteroidales bacterium]|nr:WcaF family extracellular polysaccharide biosynthesis acetyltransferase [Bacteroidales bacterium]